MGQLRVFENRNLRNNLQNEIWGIYFQIQRMRKWNMTHGLKVAMQRCISERDGEE